MLPWRWFQPAVVASNREKRLFWYFVFITGVVALGIASVGEGPLVRAEYASGAALIIIATLRLRFLKRQRQLTARSDNRHLVGGYR